MTATSEPDDHAVGAVVAHEDREARRACRDPPPSLRGRFPSARPGTPRPAGVRSTVDVDDADCVASVARRSSRFEMLLSAPSLICSVDRPSLALRMPWFSTATVRTIRVRDRQAGRVVTRAVDAETAREPGQGLLQPDVGRVRGSPGRSADAMLLTTENEAIALSSLRSARHPCRPGWSVLPAP